MNKETGGVVNVHHLPLASSTSLRARVLLLFQGVRVGVNS